MPSARWLTKSFSQGMAFDVVEALAGVVAAAAGDRAVDSAASPAARHDRGRGVALPHEVHVGEARGVVDLGEPVPVALPHQQRGSRDVQPRGGGNVGPGLLRALNRT